jgi:hypothetical protein
MKETDTRAALQSSELLTRCCLLLHIIPFLLLRTSIAAAALVENVQIFYDIWGPKDSDRGSRPL